MLKVYLVYVNDMVGNLASTFTYLYNIQFRIKTMSQLVRFLRNKIHKQKEILSQAKQELSRIKEYKWEIHHLKQQNEYLEKELQKYAHTN